MYNSGIYQIINIANGKIYIGSAKDLHGRKKDHFVKLKSNKHENGKLQNSFNKHGINNFYFVPIIYCSADDLLFYEQRAIDKYDVCKNGYNICRVAGNTLGRKHSAEAKLKMSKHRKGRKLTAEHIKNISEGQKKIKRDWLFGRKVTQKTKLKMSMAQTGEKHAGVKLKEADVIAIRKLRKDMTLKQLAIKFCVSIGCISEITKNRNWVHLLNQK